MTAHVERITIPATNREQAADKLRAFVLSCLPGKELRVTVEKAKKERTLPQVRYLNGVAVETLCEVLGFENEDMREYLNGEFFGWKLKHLPGGREAQVPIRTTTTDEDGKRHVIEGERFQRYVEFVQRFGAEHGIYIPDPDPRYWMTEERAAA